MISLLVVLAVTLSFSFLCSLLESILLRTPRSLVLVMEEEGTRSGKYLARMLRQIDEPMAAVLALNTLVTYLGGFLMGVFAVRALYEGILWLVALTLATSVLFMTEVAPLFLTGKHFEALLRPSGYVLKAVVWLLSPLLWIVNHLYRRLAASQIHTISRAELEAMTALGHNAATIEEDQRKFLGNIMDLSETTVGQIMTPRTDIAAVTADATLEEAIAVLIEHGHARIPVYEGSLDHITGIVLAREIWPASREGNTSLDALVRPVPFVPKSKTAGSLITEMRHQRVNLSVVLDEFGGTAGIVTLEDLLEEIVGDIQDEHETEEPPDIVPLSDTQFRIMGGTPVWRVNEACGLSLDDNEYDTIGGYIFGQMGEFPMAGARYAVEGAQIEVIRIRGRRIESLTLTLDEPLLS